MRPDAAASRPSLSAGTAPALLVCLAAPAFFVLLLPWLGWLLLAAGVGAAWLMERGRVRAPGPSLTRDLSLIALGMLIVSAISLEAELDDLSMLRFTLALGGAVVVPYAVSRWLYRDRAIAFPWRGGGRWRGWQWAWLGAVLVLGWLILPFYFITSGVYLNWPVVDTPDLIGRLFIGVGAVGIWDELFFICTVFALLRRHFADAAANVLQAIVFVSFLWEARVPRLGAGADDSVRAAAGRHLLEDPVAGVRRHGASAVRRGRFRGARPRPQPGAAGRGVPRLALRSPPSCPGADQGGSL